MNQVEDVGGTRTGRKVVAQRPASSAGEVRIPQMREEVSDEPCRLCVGVPERRYWIYRHSHVGAAAAVASLTL
jgi:hypothetical protein